MDRNPFGWDLPPGCRQSDLDPLPEVGECLACGGSGLHPGATFQCWSCAGSGVTDAPLSTCPRCLGTSCDPDSDDGGDPCGLCLGEGRLQGRVY